MRFENKKMFSFTFKNALLYYVQRWRYSVVLNLEVVGFTPDVSWEKGTQQDRLLQYWT
jgi:hypothetical protein